MNAPVRLTDTTLRDGSHAVKHQFSVAQVRAVAAGLDTAGVEVIEVTHGDGLDGSSFNYGFSGTDELELDPRRGRDGDQGPDRRAAAAGAGHGAPSPRSV